MDQQWCALERQYLKNKGIMSDTNTKKSEALVTDLFSTKIETVRAALDKVPSQGNARMVIPLLKTYKSWDHEPEIQEKIAVILGQIKSESAIPELVEALEDPDFDNERALILSSFWHAGLFPINDVDVLVRHAIKGDFFVTLEALTVIENIDAPLDTEMLQGAIFDIDEFLDENPEAPHAELLNQLKEVITTFYNQ